MIPKHQTKDIPKCHETEKGVSGLSSICHGKLEEVNLHRNLHCSSEFPGSSPGAVRDPYEEREEMTEDLTPTSFPRGHPSAFHWARSHFLTLT